MPIYLWNNLFRDFVTDLLISANEKGDSYNLIIVIVDWLTKMVDYKPIKVIIDRSSLVIVIINVIICYYEVSKSSVIN